MSTKAKKCLKGLRLEEYIHPAEQKYRGESGEGADLVSKGLDALSDLSVSMVRRITLGKYVEVTAQTAPYAVGVLRDVCRILDYDHQPRLYVCRKMSQEVVVGGTDSAQILLSDYTLEQLDRDMLYYVFGNAVSMLKAGHVRLATVCSVLGGSPVMMPFRLALQAYLRAADLTSDRGGLLACQNFSAAARYLLWEAGLPMSELRGKDDAELEKLCDAYLEAMDCVSTDWVSYLSSEWMKLNWSATAAVYRLRELSTWYRQRYQDVLNRREAR